MSTSMHLDKSRTPDKDGARWAIWVRDWDGIDKPDYMEICRLSDDQAKLLEATGQIHWRHVVPDWHRMELEKKRLKLLSEAEEIDRKLKRA